MRRSLCSYPSYAPPVYGKFPALTLVVLPEEGLSTAGGINCHLLPAQILHYKDGEKYEPHHDFFHDTVNARPENGGQRIATVLIYLCAFGPSLHAPAVSPALPYCCDQLVAFTEGSIPR